MNTGTFVLPKRALPKRARPFNKTKIHTPRWLKAIVGRELSPTFEEYQSVTSALWDGDPAMDRLIAWMLEPANKEKSDNHDYAHRKTTILSAFRATSQTEQDFEALPQPLQEFFSSLQQPPAWIDFDLIEEGARYIHGLGASAIFALRDLALMGGYLLSGFNQSLVKTGALEKGTRQRIAETGKWWIDCTEPGGLQPFRPGYNNTLQVRWVHALVRHGLTHRPDWDHESWGMPLNQIDMAATYLGFSVVMLMGLRKLGLPVSKRESKAVIHLWSYACWLMGVSEKWLIQSESQGLILLRHTYMTQSKPDETTTALAKALAEEPLERSFPHQQNLRRKLSYQQHLGMSRYFLGRKNMQLLGFDNPILPWYPLITLVPRALHYRTNHILPATKLKQQRLGRQVQLRMLNSVFGTNEHAIVDPNTIPSL